MSGNDHGDDPGDKTDYESKVDDFEDCVQSVYDSLYLREITHAFGYVNADSQLDSDPVLNEPDT